MSVGPLTVIACRWLGRTLTSPQKKTNEYQMPKDLANQNRFDGAVTEEQ